MPLNLDFDFTYEDSPRIPVQIRSLLTDQEATVYAFIDTGAEVSLFDDSIAFDIGIPLPQDPSATVRGLGEDVIDVRIADVELLLLEEPGLSTYTSVAFAPGITEGVGNLLGLDVLSSFDFALSHASRLGYLGRSSA